MNQAQRDEWFTAVKDGNLQRVQELINSGFDVNAKDSDKYALSYACEYLYPDIVELLLNSGADINILDNENNNLIHWTLENILLTINDENLANNEIEDKIKDTEQIIEILRAHHLDTNAINNHQLRPLDMLTMRNISKKVPKKGGKKGAWKTRRHAKKRKTLKQRMNKRKFSQTRRK